METDVKRPFATVLAAAVVLAVAAPVVAHHSPFMYAQKPVTLQAVVKSWRWGNPHCLLTFEVKGEDGAVVEWLAETQAPNTAYTLGYRPGSFKAGDTATITLRPAANGDPYGLLALVVLADGTRIGASPDAGRPAPGGVEGPREVAAP
jgi:hypothetical protein